VKRFIVVCLVGAAFVVGLWTVVITDQVLIGMAEKTLTGSGLRIDVTGLKKGFFFEIKAARITLSKSDRRLLFIDDFTGTINPFNMLAGRPPLRFVGTLGGGRVDGQAGFFRGSPATVRVERAHIKEIPFFGLSGLEGSGTLSGELRTAKGKGYVEFAVEDTRLKTVSYGGVPVPLDVFREARGALQIGGTAVKIVSFSLEGDGIYARVRGNITGKTLNASLELMPDSSFRDAIVFSALGRYRESPGYYVIPITTTLPF
jgi:type II secretion system protein N